MQSRYVLFGLTHGGIIKEKMLNDQFASKFNDNTGTIIIFKWSKQETFIQKPLIRPDNVTRNIATQYYIESFLNHILANYPTQLCGVICDANLGQVGGDIMTPLVKDVLASHPRVNLLRLFSSTPSCQTEATKWAQPETASPSYKLSDGTVIGEPTGNLAVITKMREVLLNFE